MRAIGRLGSFGPRSGWRSPGDGPSRRGGDRGRGDPAGRRGASRRTRPSSELAEWAVARFERAGLDPPDGRDQLPRGQPPGAAATSATRKDGRCRRLHGARERDGPQEPAPRDGTHLDRPERVADGRANGSSSSAACRRGTRRRLDWDERGYEQAAETMAWALGDQDPTRADPGQRSCAARRRVRAPDRRSSTAAPRQRVAARRSGWGRAACPAASRGSRRPDTRTGRRSSGRSAATAGHRCAGSSRTRTCARSCGSARSAR